MDVLRLFAGLVLPWLLGIAILMAVRTPQRALENGEVAWTIGAGYFAGAFLLTIWMRLLSLAGIHFGVAVIALPLLALTVFLGIRETRNSTGFSVATWMQAVRGFVVAPVDGRAQQLLWWLLLGWLAVRFILLGIELGLRPLYPWDAWIQWATKARVWYELGTLAPFARSDAWFAANGALYFDASPEYPPTMPLLQVWSSIALGRWDDALMNWPWWQIAVSLAFAVYGGLRRLYLSPLFALTGAVFIATLPLANVHVALAGYADLPMAAYYTVAALALMRWTGSRSRRDAAVALAFALACTQIKNPGVVWALTLLPAVVVVLLPARGMRIAAFGFVGAALLLAVLAQTNTVIFNYRLHLDFDPAWGALGQSYFLFGNWNLLWYGAIVCVLLAWRQLLSPALAPMTMVMAAGAFFLFFVFGFTNARAWVADQTTVNRATLHLAPLVVVFSMLAFDAFAKRWAARNAPMRATAEIATT